MPKLYTYVGIIIRFYSNEHLPVHVHAEYGEYLMKVTFHTKDRKIIRTTYKAEKGSKPFPSSKLKQLKKLINMEKYNILASWNDVFVLNKKVEPKVITRIK